MSNFEKLSVIIISKNEQRNIRQCLESVQFADEVILVDSGSVDNTLEIAKTFPNVQIFSTEWRGYVENKKYAISHTSFNWVLWVDADEVVTQDLQDEWFEFNKSNKLQKIGGISILRKNFFLGHLLKHSGHDPQCLVRFFHKERAEFKPKLVHESVTVKPNFTTTAFSSDLLHYSYSSLLHLFGKMNQYGLANAQMLLSKKKNVSLIKCFVSPPWMFLKFYLFQKGYLDGLIGIIVCAGLSFGTFSKYAHYFFLKKYGYTDRNIDESK